MGIGSVTWEPDNFDYEEELGPPQEEDIVNRIYVWCYHCRVKEFGCTVLPAGPILWPGEVVCPECGEVR